MQVDDGRSRVVGRFVAAGVAAVVTVALSMPQSVYATEYTAARKAGRGLAGTTCSFLELPGNLVQTTRERGAAWGFTLGFAEGVGMIVVRTLVGVYEFVSAPFEAPPGFEPIIEPEFPWDYFEE